MREHIINEIKRLAAANEGRPPGSRQFTTQTGIRETGWRGVYWARWGDALKEAGFTPNTKQEALGEQFLFKKLADACRHYQRIPTPMELRLYHRVDPEFPSDRTIAKRFRTKANMTAAIASWTADKTDYSDVTAMAQRQMAKAQTADAPQSTSEGFVYLIKSGEHYKIGRSDELERRVKEIRIALPESVVLVHSIRTDDPPGIEAYWHRRFADRRANGEWFKLANTDVTAFKRRKYQ